MEAGYAESNLVAVIEAIKVRIYSRVFGYILSDFFNY